MGRARGGGEAIGLLESVAGRSRRRTELRVEQRHDRLVEQAYREEDSGIRSWLTLGKPGSSLFGGSWGGISHKMEAAERILKRYAANSASHILVHRLVLAATFQGHRLANQSDLDGKKWGKTLSAQRSMLKVTAREIERSGIRPAWLSKRPVPDSVEALGALTLRYIDHSLTLLDRADPPELLADLIKTARYELEAEREELARTTVVPDESVVAEYAKVFIRQSELLASACDPQCALLTERIADDGLLLTGIMLHTGTLNQIHFVCPPGYEEMIDKLGFLMEVVVGEDGVRHGAPTSSSPSFTTLEIGAVALTRSLVDMQLKHVKRLKDDMQLKDFE